jgi:hypothetical protein
VFALKTQPDRTQLPVRESLSHPSSHPETHVAIAASAVDGQVEIIGPRDFDLPLLTTVRMTSSSTLIEITKI